MRRPFWLRICPESHLQNSTERARSVRARLQSCRQFSRKMLGFSPCVSLISIVCNSAAAKAGILFGFLRHDSSRALTLQTFPTSNFASSSRNCHSQGCFEKARRGTLWVPRRKELKMSWALQAAEKLIRAVGRGFIPGTKATESAPALAAEVCLLPIFPENKPFSAACLSPDGLCLKTPIFLQDEELLGKS